MKNRKSTAKKEIRDRKTPVHDSLLDKMENMLQKNGNLCFWIIFAVTGAVSMLLYDPRISLTGDDAGYVLAANRFIKDFSFPGEQAALYVIAMSPVTYFFGTSLFPLKLFSLLSMLGFMYFTYAALRRKIPASILMPALALLSVNSYVLYYASQTYSEAFYMFMQSIFVSVFFRFIMNGENAGQPEKIRGLPLIALAALAVAVTRPIGFSAVAAVAGYFMFYRQWKNLGFFLLSFAAMYVAYFLLKDWIWGGGTQLASSASGYMNKNPYRAEDGMENFAGFLVRFWKNSVQYLSNGLFRITGFTYKSGENSVFRMLLVYAGAVGGLCLSFRRNRYLFAATLAAGVFIVASFIVLQVMWNQERLIIPVFPFILMSILACLYYILSKKGWRPMQFIYPAFIGILFIAGLGATVKAIPEARKLTDKYSGLAPDWFNYLKASEWAGTNLKEKDVVACRKPTMSTIYGNGKHFYGIYSIPTGDAAAFMQEWTVAPDRYAVVPVAGKTGQQLDAVRSFYRARAELDEKAYWLLNSSDSIAGALDRAGIKTLNLPETQALIAHAGNSFVIFDADMLLGLLKKAGVTHIMTANLRANPKQKTDNIVNTVERYFYYVTEKYQNIIQNISHQEGATENEPAIIYEINWSAADGLKI